ncbi:MAG: DNA-processing protein DprA [Prevotellaceae bacterium]|jgi:DNA processing protein|nr:DNA-processing protein DprA [Prevotellaceae bacterium]
MSLLHATALTFIKGIGPISAKTLLAHFGSFEAVFAENSAVLAKIPRIGNLLADQKIKNEALQRAEIELAFAEKNRIKVHLYTDKTYPFRLKECEDSPIVLYSLGADDLNSGHFLSVVGTRNVTAYGKEICAKIISELAENQKDTTIVSGLAYGTDACAHRAALNENLKTFAVVAHGLDTIYPSQHKSLAEKIIKSGGAIITEYPTKTVPEASNFVQRNRIIAGMCDATLVVESAARGGALLTASAANSYNRDVFAIAGRIGDTFSEGCNNLIKTNCAQMITSAADIEQFMSWEKGEAKEQLLFTELTDEERKIVETLHSTPMSANDLSREMKIPVQKMVSTLILMEFKGLITALPGNFYKVKI